MQALFEIIVLTVEAAAVMLLFFGLVISTGRFSTVPRGDWVSLLIAPIAETWAVRCC